MARNKSNITNRGNDPNGKNGQLIEVRDVVKAYKTEAGDFLALKNVNLDIGYVSLYLSSAESLPQIQG